MDKKQKEISRILQILLWIWFGLITSFSATNVVNIAKLETEVKNLNNDIIRLQYRMISLKQYTQHK